MASKKVTEFTIIAICAVLNSLIPSIFSFVQSVKITNTNTETGEIKSKQQDTNQLIKQINDVRKSTDDLLKKLEDDIRQSQESINEKNGIR